MKQKNTNIAWLCCLMLIFSQPLFAQDDDDSTKSIKPLRIGVKVGVPNIITANAEYVTPLLGNRVALAIDWMSLSKTVDETSINYNNFEIGTNIYFNKKGKGLYGGLSYFSFDGEGTFTETEFDNGSIEDGTGKIEFNTINLKLGAKLGRTFYFRIEVGYGFGDIPEFIVVTNNDGTQTTSEDIPEIPGIETSGIPNFNFGIGFSFL
ncbi:hypothetical protein [Psychroserpens luteus]|uniref:Outer membrane protein beta-barrel domain-containing protein n=1 Tax=Psychroserpens luteus TaxID=1434066 RepID=A0ABW5ZPC5_9FLAO|nr:hypothetical protein [Psychroserpens luteus]